ncbi:MAG: ABC transporter ATP-binding protein [Anaerolineales bacterium]|nr:ABC transporter ATP-binding protein [Anaerolineales bacterium]
MIQTEDLSKQFGDFWAVDGLSFEVHPGQILALLGQNGAGKTTTVRLLTAVLAPSRGWAQVAGYDVRKQADKVRASVGVLTEQHGLYLRMSGAEYLDFFGQIYRLNGSARRARIAALLEYFDLTGVAGQNIGAYSKGMRQKLALARALIHEPPVLLLDEPTSAMDPESARLVRDSIASLRSENRTILICTHNLAEAELLADQIAIIYRGKILISGTVEELKRRLLGPAEYEVRIRGAWPPGSFRLPVGVTLIGEVDSVRRFRVEDANQSNPLLLQALVSQHVQVVAMQEAPRSLEQVYLAAMSQVRRE